MSESTQRQLKILVERVVRPVRASPSCKSKMREELLAHVTAVFEEETARLGSEEAALARTAERFGSPADLTGQLQDAVPAFDPIRRRIEHFSDYVTFQPGESTVRRAIRFTIAMEVIALQLLVVMLVAVSMQFEQGMWPASDVWTSILWLLAPVLPLSAYLGCVLCIFETTIRKLMCEPGRNSWRRFVLVLTGAILVAMAMGLPAFGTSPKKAFWISLFLVGFPLVMAWGLARNITARKRNHDDWASLQIE